MLCRQQARKFEYAKPALWLQKVDHDKSREYVNLNILMNSQMKVAYVDWKLGWPVNVEFKKGS